MPGALVALCYHVVFEHRGPEFDPDVGNSKQRGW